MSAGKNAHNFKTPSSQDVAVALVTPPKNVSFLLRDEQGASAAQEKLDNGCAVLCSVLCCESYTIRARRFVLCADYCRVNCSPWPCMGPTQRCFANHLDPLVGERNNELPGLSLNPEESFLIVGIVTHFVESHHQKLLLTYHTLILYI